MAEPILINSKIADLYKRYIPAVKHQFGDSCECVWNESEMNCYNCFYDAVKKSSNGKFNPTGSGIVFTGICPVCSGVGKLVTTGSVSLSGNASYVGPFDGRKMIPGGQFDDVELELSMLRSELEIPSGIFSGRLASDVMKYLKMNGEKWVNVKAPQEDGFIIDGTHFTILLKLKRTNMR